MAAAVHPDYDKQGLARQVLTALTERAHATGITRVFAPIRPTSKHRYPHVPMDRYAGWTRPDGLSIDPWIRTHQRLGARIVRTHRTPWSSPAPWPSGDLGGHALARVRRLRRA